MRYAKVYNSFYRRAKTLFKKPKWVASEHIEDWIRDHMHPKVPLHVRLPFARHVSTIARTQALGTLYFTHTMVQNLSHAHRLAHIGWLCLLRRLQRRIIQYLWRPGSKLMLANDPTLLFP